MKQAGASPSATPAREGRFGAWAAAGTVLFFYALDQATKWEIVQTLPYETAERIIIPGFFSLVHWGNTGAAFSSFSNSNGMFIVLAAGTVIALLIFAMRGAFQHWATRIAVCLLSAGVLGNLTDRILRHHVVDFLLFNLHLPHADPWPAFNIADSCICTAAAILLVRAWFEEK